MVNKNKECTKVLAENITNAILEQQSNEDKLWFLKVEELNGR